MQRWKLWLQYKWLSVWVYWDLWDNEISLLVVHNQQQVLLSWLKGPFVLLVRHVKMMVTLSLAGCDFSCHFENISKATRCMSYVRYKVPLESWIAETVLEIEIEIALVIEKNFPLPSKGTLRRGAIGSRKDEIRVSWPMLYVQQVVGKRISGTKSWQVLGGKQPWLIWGSKSDPSEVTEFPMTQNQASTFQTGVPWNTIS